MHSATWNGVTIATSEQTILFDGSCYFPPQSVNRAYLEDSDHTSVCPYKGTARYFHVRIGSVRNENAAWSYANPTPDAMAIKDHIAFWKGVEVV